MTDSDTVPSDALEVRKKRVDKQTFVSLQEDVLWDVEVAEHGRREEKWDPVTREEKWASVTIDYKIDHRAAGVLNRTSLASWATAFDRTDEEPDTHQEFVSRLYDDVAGVLWPTFARYDDVTDKIPLLVSVEFEDGEEMSIGSIL